MEKIWNRVLKLSNTEKAELNKRFIKLMEEFGEFSAAYLKIDGFKVDKENLSPIELQNNFLEEGIDTMIMVMDILANQGYSYEEITDMFNKKLDAWNEVLIEKGDISVDNDIDFTEPIEANKETPQDNGTTHDMALIHMALIQNAVKCLRCGEIIQSVSRHNYVTCQCDNSVMVDGGLDYERYGANNMDLIESYHLYNNDNFEDIKAKLLWGTRGINGDQPLKWVPLISCDSNHLNNILKNVKKLNPIHNRVILSILEDRK